MFRPTPLSIYLCVNAKFNIIISQPIRVMIVKALRLYKDLRNYISIHQENKNRHYDLS